MSPASIDGISVEFIVDSKLSVSPVGSQPFQLIIFSSSEERGKEFL
jgi:hypothetical protein